MLRKKTSIQGNTFLVTDKKDKTTKSNYEERFYLKCISKVHIHTVDQQQFQQDVLIFFENY
jgi:hypothetical protein